MLKKGISLRLQHIQGFVNQTWLGRYGVPVEDSTNMLIWSFIVSVFSLGGWLGAIHSGSLPAVHGRCSEIQTHKYYTPNPQ